jgi:hypothetical protein
LNEALFEHINKVQYTSFSTAGPLHYCALYLHRALKLPHVCDYTTELCRQEVEVPQNHENAKVRNIAQVEAQHTKYKRLKLGDSEA